MKGVMRGRREVALDIWQDEGRGRVVGGEIKPQILVDLGSGVTGDMLASNRCGIGDREGEMGTWDEKGSGRVGMGRPLYENKLPRQAPKRC